MFYIGKFATAAIAQLGERQTEDLKVPGSIPGLGTSIHLLQARGASMNSLALPTASKISCNSPQVVSAPSSGEILPVGAPLCIPGVPVARLGFVGAMLASACAVTEANVPPKMCTHLLAPAYAAEQRNLVCDGCALALRRSHGGLSGCTVSVSCPVPCCHNLCPSSILLASCSYSTCLCLFLFLVPQVRGFVNFFNSYVLVSSFFCLLSCFFVFFPVTCSSSSSCAAGSSIYIASTKHWETLVLVENQYIIANLR